MGLREEGGVGDKERERGGGGGGSVWQAGRQPTDRKRGTQSGSDAYMYAGRQVGRHR